MSTKKGLVRGATTLGAGRLVINLGSLASTLVLARILTPEDFGVVAIATATLGIVMALTELSLGSALVRQKELTRDHIDTAWTMMLIRTLLISLGFCVAAWPLSVLYDDARLVPVLMLTGVTGALQGFYNPRIALMAKDMKFRPLMILQLTQRFAGFAIAIAIALVTRSYWAIVLGNAAGAVIAATWSYWMEPYRPRLTLSRSRDLMGFSFWLFVSEVVNVLNWRMDQLLIGVMLTKAQLGTYVVADNIAAVPSREVTLPLTQPLFPALVKVKDDRERLADRYMTAQAAIGLIALPAGFGLAVIADPFVRLALGDQWLAAIPIMQVLGCSLALQTLSVGLRPLAMALDQTRVLFVRNLIGLLVRIACVVPGMMLWGLMGLVWGRALSTVIGLLIAFEWINRLTGVSVTRQFVHHWRTFASVVLMWGVGWLVLHEMRQIGITHPALMVAVTVPACAMTYLLSLTAFWWASGRPSGAERELCQLARQVIIDFRARRQSPLAGA